MLPALVSGLSYTGLVIRDGDTASIELERIIFKREKMSNVKAEQLKVDLLKYCELDTLALVRLHEKLSGLVS
jgi:hypothetical protein